MVIRVGVQDGEGEGVVVRLDVEDTGPGMSAAQQEEVFDSFAQADASTTRRYGGTGLGLAISRQLVGLMGGEAGVESELGRGSRFWFTAKLGRGPAPEPTLVPDRTALAGVRALVVDDNAASRTVGQLLEEPHMRVSVADSAGAALAALHDAAHEGDPYAVAHHRLGDARHRRAGAGPCHRRRSSRGRPQGRPAHRLGPPRRGQSGRARRRGRLP